MITLEQVKLHLRVDHDTEDAAIALMIEAATLAALDYLNLNTLPDPTPAPIDAAMLLQVGDLYTNRERVTDRQLYGNDTYERLLNPYRAMAV